MKLIKNLSLLLIFILLVSCGSDDDGGGTTNDVFAPTITLDASTAITRPAGSDITDLIDFGQGTGIPASDYTVELDINDRLQLRQPSGLSSDFTLWYSRVDFFEENPLDPGQFDIPVDEQDVIGVWLNFEIPSSASFTPDPLITTGSGDLFTELDLFAINQDSDNIDYKYDIRVVIEQNGTLFGYYFIDPKIRVKSLN